MPTSVDDTSSKDVVEWQEIAYQHQYIMIDISIEPTIMQHMKRVYRIQPHNLEHVIYLNPAVTDVRDQRAPGIRDQIFDPSRLAVWPTQDSLYQHHGAPIPNYFEPNTVLFSERSQKNARKWYKILYDEPSHQSIPFHNNLAPFSAQWTGMDLGNLKQKLY